MFWPKICSERDMAQTNPMIAKQRSESEAQPFPRVMGKVHEVGFAFIMKLFHIDQNSETFTAQMALQSTWIDEELPPKIQYIDKQIDKYKAELKALELDSKSNSEDPGAEEKREDRIFQLGVEIESWNTKRKSCLDNCWDPMIKLNNVSGLRNDRLSRHL
jgi:hypothetical protein